MKFDEIWRLWWKTSAIKSAKSHQRPSIIFDEVWWDLTALVEKINHQIRQKPSKTINNFWWSLMKFDGFDGKHLPSNPPKAIKGHQKNIWWDLTALAEKPLSSKPPKKQLGKSFLPESKIFLIFFTRLLANYEKSSTFAAQLCGTCRRLTRDCPIV